MFIYTLPEANIAPENTWKLEDEFPFEKALHSQVRTVSFREGKKTHRSL